jgi:hypothetical protein
VKHPHFNFNLRKKKILTIWLYMLVPLPSLHREKQPKKKATDKFHRKRSNFYPTLPTGTSHEQNTYQTWLVGQH